MYSRHLPDRADVEAYLQRARAACFICEMVAGNPDYRVHHEFIYEDDDAIVFLNRYPPLYGYVLVAPREHRERVTGDFTVEEYLSLQRLIYWVGEAVRTEVPTERLYLLSLGSQQANRHVHWHVAALPPGIPFEAQQLEALNTLEVGFLEIPRQEMAALAGRLRGRLLELLRDG